MFEHHVLIIIICKINTTLKIGQNHKFLHFFRQVNEVKLGRVRSNSDG